MEFDSKLKFGVFKEVFIQQETKGASGEILPFYMDFKSLHENPELRRKFLDAFSQAVPTDTEVIGGIQKGGASFASGIADRLDLKYAWTRDPDKSHGISRKVDGANVEGRIVLPFEDVSTTAGSIIKDIEQFRNAGAIIHSSMIGVIRDEVVFERLDAIGVNAIYFIGPKELEEFTL